MESPPPSPQPSPQPAIEYNDLFAFMLGLSAFVITLIAMRIAHVYIARKSMQRNNYHSKRQWIASLSLNFLSIFTCFFTLVNIISDIVSVGLIISKDNTTGDLRDAMGEIFFVSYALQNLSYNVWLIARDRALQSSFFQTNVIVIYIAAALALISALCNYYAPYSGFSDVDVGYSQILGQILQLLILCIMTLQFTRPLLNYASGTRSQTTENIRAVVKRTALGAMIHGAMTMAFAALLFAQTAIVEAIGWVNWYMLVCTSVWAPLVMHISISHRDDMPLSSIVESFRNTSSAHNLNSRSIVQMYMFKAIESLKTENAEIEPVPKCITRNVLTSTDASSFTDSPGLELSKNGALSTDVLSDSSVCPDRIIVTKTFDDTT